MSIERRFFLALTLVITTFLPAAARANASGNCADALVEEAVVADLFPGLDRTFFRLFDWQEKSEPTIKRKFEGVPTSPVVAEVLRVYLTRADAKISPSAGAERYQMSIFLRTNDRAVQESLARALEAEYEKDDSIMSFWGHQVTNAHVRDGDFWISFLESPFAKNVSMGLGIARHIYDFLDDGGRLGRLAVILARPRRIAPPVIALAPPPGAKIH